MSDEALAAAYRRARGALTQAAAAADPSGIALEARELVCLAAGIDRDRFFLAQDAPVDSARLDALLARRISGEPLAYILGEWDFCGRRFRTDRRALIPRDDSAAVLELFLEKLPQTVGEPVLLDLCTGTGCLGISAVAALAAQNRPSRAVLADLSPAALALAAENAALHGLTERVTCVTADALALQSFPLTGFDGCICNPPYIETAVVPTLAREVAAFEPHMALDGGADGLDFYRAIVRSAPRVLRPGAVLAFEVGFAQADAVAALLCEAGCVDVSTKNDLQSIPRAVSGIIPPAR